MLSNSNRKTRSAEVGARVLTSTLTPDAKDWLIAALDPFHDFQRNFAGYPDTDASNTVVACYTSEVDIVAPAGAPGNWDAHVFTLPITNAESLFQVQSTAEDYAFKTAALGGDPDPTVRGVGPLTVWAVDSGQPLFPRANAQFAPTHFSPTVIDASTTVGTGLGRVIAWGFEIVNTTADLTKQGALTAYRMPQMGLHDESLLPQRATVTVGDKRTSMRFRSLPSSPAEAVLLGGARQWAAADGVYMVVPQGSIQNPIVPPTNVGSMYSTRCPCATNDYAMVSTSVPATAPNNLPVLTALVAAPQKYVPFNSCGVMLTGLSPTTTFRVKMKMYCEKAPTFSEPDISVLATPSAPYDATCLQLYSAILTQLPIAVPVAMNGFGDWFKTILGVVADVAPTVGGTLFGAPGTLLGGSLASLSRGISSIAFKDETKQAMHRMDTEAKTRKAPTAPKPVGRVKRVTIVPSDLRAIKRKLKSVKPVRA